MLAQRVLRRAAGWDGWTVGRGATADWWRNAVFYQIYVRSFADGNGDGVGDLAGIRSRLGYLADLGVDALWLTHMRDAVDSLELSAEQDATLWGYLEMAARSMQNRFPDDGGGDLSPA